MTLSRSSLFSLLFLLPWSAAATTPIVQYPVQGKVPASTLKAAADLILGGVQLSKVRGGFEPGSPFLLPAQCSPVTSACLAALGKGKHVLYANAKAKEDGLVSVTLWLISPSGERSRPVRFEFDPFLQNARSGYQAIALLEQQAYGVGPSADASVPTPSSPDLAPSADSSDEAVAASAPSADLGAELAPEQAVPVVVPPPASSALAPSTAVASSAAAVAAKQEPAHSSAWMSNAGNIATYGGLGVFAGGAVFGLLSRSINDDLSARYQSGELRGTDSGKYQQVRTFNLLANSLMVGGAVATAAGLAFWALAPSASPTPGGAYFSVSGRF